MPSQVPDPEWNLLLAVNAGDTKRAEELITAGADPGFGILRSFVEDDACHESFEWNGDPAVLYATAYRHKAILQMALTRPIATDILSKALNMAAIRDRDIRPVDLDIISMLLDAGADFISENELFGHSSVLADVATEIPREDWNDLYVEVVRLLLKRGADLEGVDGNVGTTALGHAVYNGNHDLVHILLEAGADVNVEMGLQDSPLAEAALVGHIGMVRTLLDNGALPRGKNGDDQALHSAARRGHCEIIKLLLDRGCHHEAHVGNRTTALHMAAQCGQVSAMQILLDHGYDFEARDSESGATPLQLAVVGEKENAVKFLLDHGAKVNVQDSAKSQTALHRASLVVRKTTGYRTPIEWFQRFSSRLNIMTTLLAHGADVNARDSDGLTPLHMAVSIEETGYHDHSHVHLRLVFAKLLSQNTAYRAVQVLLDAGARVNEPDIRGHTPLHVAASAWSVECMVTLMNSGAHVNVLDEYGRTPLHYAAIQRELHSDPTDRRRFKRPFYRAVQFLLGHQADANIRDYEDLTAVDQLQMSLKSRKRYPHDQEEVTSVVKLLRA